MVKVTAKFIFDPPFNIIIQGEYGSSPQSLKTNSDEIVVYAPALYEPSLSDKPLWSPKPQNIIGKVDGKPIWKANCIVIDIRRDFLTIPIVDKDQKALVAKARDILYTILTLCRWRAKQLYRVTRADIEEFDYRLRYFDTANDPINAGPGGVQATGARYLMLPGPLIKSNDWNSIRQDLVSGTVPELYDMLLLDALSVVSDEPRRAVLDAAIACEVFIKNFCDTASENNPEIYPYVYSALIQRVGFLYYFHEVLKYLFRHSLNEDKPHLYEELGYLSNTNNNVKHKGQCHYTISKKSKAVDIPVDSTRAKKFINAVEEAIQYTKSLGC